MFLIPVDADYTTIAAKRLFSMAFYFVVKTRTNIKFRNYCINNVTEVGESRPLFFLDKLDEVKETQTDTDDPQLTAFVTFDMIYS